MFGVSYFGASYYGPNYFGPSVSDVIAAATGAGGSYADRRQKRPHYLLPPLEDYEKRIKKALEEEKEKNLKELKNAKARKKRAETAKNKAETERNLEVERDKEIRIFFIIELIAELQEKIAKIEEQTANVAELARILRDDEELLTLLYS